MASLTDPPVRHGVRRRSSRRVGALRFLLILLFPLGIASTWSSWGNTAIDALAVSILASCCFALFLTRIRDLSSNTLMPILVAGILIIGYPLKAYFLIAVPWTPEALGPFDSVRWYGTFSIDIVYRSYRMAMLSLSVFFVSVFCLMPLLPGVPRESDWMKRIDRRRLAGLLRLLCVGSVLAVFALQGLCLWLGIGRMGVEPIRLPFRLGGFIVFLQAWLTGGLYLIFFLAWRARQKRIVVLAIGALIFTSIGAAIVTASRGAMLWWLVQIVLLLIATKAFRWRWVVNVRAVAILLTLLVAHPLVTEYRGLTTLEGVRDIPALGIALRTTGLSLVQDSFGLFSRTSATVFARVLGLEALIIVQQRMGTPAPDQARVFVLDEGQPIGMYYTREVLGVDTLATRNICGTLGTLWLFGGEWLAVWGMFPYILVLFVTRTLLTRGLRTRLGPVSLSIDVAGPVLAAGWALGAMLLTMEGDLIGGTGFLNPERLLLLFVAASMTEGAARWIVWYSRLRLASRT